MLTLEYRIGAGPAKPATSKKAKLASFLNKIPIKAPQTGVSTMERHVQYDPSSLNLKSRFSDFNIKLLSQKVLDDTFSDSRDGHLNYSLYGTGGSVPLQSIGTFAQHDLNYYGSEPPPSGPGAGASRCTFTEGLEYMAGNGAITFPDGTTQKIAARVAVMASGIQIWSGHLHHLEHGQDHVQDTPASAQYYITLAIRRQRIENNIFHLIIFPVQRLYKDQDAGHHRLRIYNDSSNTLLKEQDLSVAADPNQSLEAIFEISGLVSKRDFIRIEVVAQIALTNPNSPVQPVAGGSYCGIGFADNV
jgi:hypothetical protein